MIKMTMMMYELHCFLKIKCSMAFHHKRDLVIPCPCYFRIDVHPCIHVHVGSIRCRLEGMFSPIFPSPSCVRELRVLCERRRVHAKAKEEKFISQSLRLLLLRHAYKKQLISFFFSYLLQVSESQRVRARKNLSVRS